MKISGRIIAYLLILLIAFVLGGGAYAGAQGFVGYLPVPVEESGIVEIVRWQPVGGVSGRGCSSFNPLVYEVPQGKRLIVEYLTFVMNSDPTRMIRNPVTIELETRDDYNSIIMSQFLVLSRSWPVTFSGPITTYANPGDKLRLRFRCPPETGVEDWITFRTNLTGRLVPYPHPSTIPTATPPPP